MSLSKLNKKPKESSFRKVKKMSESVEENFCYFGKPLDPYDEDAFPKKKPISVEDQIATDTEGRRRFHGAFTGGFSAGFFNTVGSLEGWTPNEFKSTRQDKAKSFTQKPEDFMDTEDFGEHGIAHQTVKATKEYSTIKKRKRQIFADGPIPGEPVLETLLSSGNETVGYLLLKNIGIQDKISKQQEELDLADGKVYGCQMPTAYRIPKSIENKQYQIPEIYKTFLKDPKSNTFGLGYKGLDKVHVNLFQSAGLVMKDKNNKNVSIRGQAFGVGAFEEEDDDIYVKEDMSKYDFELTKEKSKKEKAKENLLFGMFKLAQTPLLFKKLYTPPKIPHSFTGKHKVRKSRFEPIAEKTPTTDRKEINPAIRAAYLGEKVEETYTESKSVVEPVSNCTKSKEENPDISLFDISTVSISDRFVSASQTEDISNIMEPVKKSETTHGTKELKEAARMKMFGLLTRFTTDWHPCSVLCKRFNVPEPFLDRPEMKSKKRTKNLIFEYQKHNEVESILTPGLLTHPKPEKIENLEDTSAEQSIVNHININEIKQTPEPIQNELREHEKESQQNELEEFKHSDVVETESLPKDITEKVDVAQKLDLFKAVFLSSSESEDEDVEEKPDKIEELKANVLSDSLIPKIRPIKEGILSNVNFHKFSKPNNVEETMVEETSLQEVSTAPSSIQIKDEEKITSYGPALPSQKVVVTNLTKVNLMSSDSEDDWVEKSDDNSRKKSKHKKKHKKEKHRKHKRDRKK